MMGNTLSTTFPKLPTGNMTSPIVTSKKADEHILNIGDIISKANIDIANATASLKQAQQAKSEADKVQKQQDIENKQNQTPEQSTVSILNALTGAQNTEAKPDATQQNVLDTNAEQNKIDEKNLSTVSNAIDSMNAGTYPLTPIEKASVDNIATVYKTAYASAQELASNQLGGQMVQNAKYGLQMYSPQEALSRIANITREGGAKIGELNTKLLDAQSKLTQAFQDSDFKTATSLYNKISDTIKARTTEINDINKSIADITKEMHQNAKDNARLQLDALIHDDTVSYQEKQQAIAQSTLDERTRHDKATEAAQKQIDTVITSPTNVNMNGDGTVNPADQQAFLNNLPGGANGELGNLVKKIADYTINPSSLPTRQYKGVGGLTQAQVVSLASQYDPTYDSKQYATRQALIKNFSSGIYSQNINSLNTAISHMSSLADASKSLGNSSFTPFNAGINAIKSTFGSGTPGKAQLDISAVTNEIATALRKSGVTDTDIKNLGILNKNSAPDQVNKYIEGATELLSGRLQNLQDTYTLGMGKSPVKGFLNPSASEALIKLKNSGLNINVPQLDNTAIGKVAAFGDANPAEQAKIAQMEKDKVPYDAILRYYGQQ
jgi:hypothetical protein